MREIQRTAQVCERKPSCGAVERNSDIGCDEGCRQHAARRNIGPSHHTHAVGRDERDVTGDEGHVRRSIRPQQPDRAANVDRAAVRTRAQAGEIGDAIAHDDRSREIGDAQTSGGNLEAAATHFDGARQHGRLQGSRHVEVGLRFTAETLRAMGRLLGPVVVAILALMAGSFLFALGLSATTSASLLESYLATTPGGLYAVLAVAFGAGADTTFVVAVQTLRLLSLVILAPFVVRWVVGRVAR